MTKYNRILITVEVETASFSTVHKENLCVNIELNYWSESV